MTAAAGHALEQALAYYRAPALLSAARDRPLPDDVIDVLRVAAGDTATIEQLADASGEAPTTVSDASVFFVQQVLFVAGADSYRVLGVNHDAPDSRIKEHYRWLVRWLHPDRNVDDWDSVYADRVNVAWQTLRLPDRRREYDLQRPVASASMDAAAGAPSRPAARRFNEPEPAVLSARAVQRLPAIVLGALGAGAISVLLLMWITADPPAPRVVQVPEDIVLEPAALRALPPAEPASPVAATPAPASAASTAPESVEAAEPPSPPPSVSAPSLAPPRTVGAAVAEPSRVDPPATPFTPATNARMAPPEIADVPPPVVRTPASPASPVLAAPAANRAPAPATQRAEAPTPPEPTPQPAAPPEVMATPAVEPAQASAATAAAPTAPTVPTIDPAIDGELAARAVAREFSRAYGAGDINALMRLFTADARNNRGGRDAIVFDYQSLFSSTTDRELRLVPTGWISRDTAEGTLLADYEASVTSAGARKSDTSRGQIRFDLRRVDGDYRISQVRHDDR